MSYAKKNSILPPKPTEEEINAQKVRALVQKREAFAEGILFNALHSVQLTEDNYKGLVALSVKAAEEFLDRLYKVSADEDKPE